MVLIILLTTVHGLNMLLVINNLFGSDVGSALQHMTNNRKLLPLLLHQEPWVIIQQQQQQ